MNWLIWDLVALLMIALLVWNSARNGFLRSIVSFLSAIIAAVAAGVLSEPAARFLYDSVVRDAMKAVISRRVAEALEQGLTSAGDWLALIPQWMQRMVPQGAEVSGSLTVEELSPMTDALIESALSQPVMMLLRGACFFVLFTVLIVVARSIARMLGAVNKIPLVGSVNTVLGGVLGVGQALIVLYLLAVIAQVYIAYTGGGSRYINAPIINEGYLFSFFFRLAG